jgi:hypothetical protein
MCPIQKAAELTYSLWAQIGQVVPAPAPGPRLPWGLSWVGLVVAVIVFAAVVAIAYLVITRGMGVTIPEWVTKCLWIFVAAFFGIVLILLLVSLF